MRSCQKFNFKARFDVERRRRTASCDCFRTLAVSLLDVSKLAQMATWVSDPGDDVSKGLINWGYAIADRSIRVHDRGPEPIARPSPSFPL
jgi:hypothetical protein